MPGNNLSYIRVLQSWSYFLMTLLVSILHVYSLDPHLLTLFEALACCMELGVRYSAGRHGLECNRHRELSA